MTVRPTKWNVLYVSEGEERIFYSLPMVLIHLFVRLFLSPHRLQRSNQEALSFQTLDALMKVQNHPVFPAVAPFTLHRHCLADRGRNGLRQLQIEAGDGARRQHRWLGQPRRQAGGEAPWFGTEREVG